MSWHLRLSVSEAALPCLRCPLLVALPCEGGAPLVLGRDSLYAHPTCSEQALSLSVDADGPHVMVLGSMGAFLHRGGEEVKLAKGAPPLPLREGDELRLRAKHRLLFRVCAGSASQAPVSSGPASADVSAEALGPPSLKRDSAQRDASQPEEPPAKRRAPDAATAGGPAAALPPVGTRPPSSPASPPPSPPLLTCVICCAELHAQQGLRCASGHFVCCVRGPEGEPSCAEGHAASTLADPQRVLASGSLRCPLAGAGSCTAPPFSLEQLTPFQHLLASVMTLGEQHAVAAALAGEKARLEAEAAARAALSLDDQQLSDGVKAVTDLLNEICPRCKQLFAGFDGCFALTCSHCAAGFCALCNKDCGGDAHAHIAPGGGCPFIAASAGGIVGEGTYAITLRCRREDALWNYLHVNFPAASPAAARRALLDDATVKAALLGVGLNPVDFMNDANRPKQSAAVRAAQHGAGGAGGAGGAEGVLGYVLAALGRMGAGQAQMRNDARGRRRMRAPAFAAEPEPELPPPPPMRDVMYAVELQKRVKGRACDAGCGAPIANGALQLRVKSLKGEDVFVDGVEDEKGRKIKLAVLQAPPSRCFHPDCFKQQFGHPAELWKDLFDNGLNKVGGEAQKTLQKLFPADNRQGTAEQEQPEQQPAERAAGACGDAAARRAERQ